MCKWYGIRFISFAGDTIPPVVTCPVNQTRIIELGVPSVAVTWDEETVTDLSPVFLVSRSYDAGELFLVGVETVTIRYRDSSNNIGECSFVITVETG